MPPEIGRYRRIQLAPRGRDGIECGDLGGLEVFGNRTIVGHQLLDDGAGAASERLVLRLHAVDGLHGIEGRALHEHVPEGDDRGDGCQAQGKARADSYAQPPATRGCRRLRRRRGHDAARCRFSGGFLHTT